MRMDMTDAGLALRNVQVKSHQRGRGKVEVTAKEPEFCSSSPSTYVSLGIFGTSDTTSPFSPDFFD